MKGDATSIVFMQIQSDIQIVIIIRGGQGQETLNH